jgi:hypothetical protein
MNDFLEVLQEDVAAYLRNVPALAGVPIVVNNQGDLEADVNRALAPTRAGSTGRFGLCVVVLLPEVVETDENLPGPVVRVELELQTVEHVVTNRGPQGTGMRSSQAALTALNALHHLGLGSHALHAAKDPVTPLPIKPGYVSHAVRLRCLSNGVELVPKCGQVSAVIDDAVSGMTVSGITNPTILNGDYSLWEDGPEFAYPEYRKGDYQLIKIAGRWTIKALDPAPPPGGGIYIGGTVYAEETPPVNFGEEYAASPELVLNWTLLNGTTGIIAVAAITEGQGIDLSCETEGAAIYYTTDGSFPTPEKGRYVSRIFLPNAGTVVRAAAYKAEYLPGDVTEILISE